MISLDGGRQAYGYLLVGWRSIEIQIAIFVITFRGADAGRRRISSALTIDVPSYKIDLYLPLKALLTQSDQVIQLYSDNPEPGRL